MGMSRVYAPDVSAASLPSLMHFFENALYHPFRGSAAPRSNFRGRGKYSNVLGYRSSRNGTLVEDTEQSCRTCFERQDLHFVLSVADDDNDGKEIKRTNSFSARGEVAG